MSQKQDDFFGEPISVYTDAEAIEDGTIADLTQYCVVQFRGFPVNRMTSHLFEDDPWLFERLVVPFPDRADVIADYVGRALRERSEIMPAYSRYVVGYNERARRSVGEFLADGA